MESCSTEVCQTRFSKALFSSDQACASALVSNRRIISRHRSSDNRPCPPVDGQEAAVSAKTMPSRINA